MMARAVKTHAPGLYWRLRNGAALARWCGSTLFGALPARDEPYDERFWASHDTGNWERFASLVVEHFAPRSVVDIGCGDGKLLAALRAVAPQVRTRGFDGSAAALRAAEARGVAVERYDLAFGTARSHAPLAARVRGCDLAISLETAEHLPPWSAHGLVAVLGEAPVVLFSGAQPLQGGTLHMNERPLEYWASRFAAIGLDPHPGEPAFRAALRGIDLPWWYAANVQVFRRP